METKEQKIKVVVNGLGKMALVVAEAVALTEDMELLPFSLVGSDFNNKNLRIGGKKFQTFGPDEKHLFLRKTQNRRPDVIIEFSLATAVAENVDFYTKNLFPFVLGTTFGNLTNLPAYIEQKVSEAKVISAVVAPNMAKDIVLMQAMFDFAAKNFPGALKDFIAYPVESHQSTKPDTSGTAKAIVADLITLGAECSIEKIEKRRTEADYEAMNIPREHWGGHGWHTYSLVKNSADVFLEFTHNINGRQPYIDGTLAAARFLFDQRKEMHAFGKVFSMINVLKNTI